MKTANRFVAVLLLLLSGQSLFGQRAIQFNWLASAASYNNGGAMIVKGIASDTDGSTVAVGYFTETVDFAPGADIYNLKSTGAGDIFIAKYAKEGKLVYAYGLGATGFSTNEVANGIAIDGAGNVYITGSFNKTIDFDPGPGAAVLSAPVSTEIFVLSLDKNGLFRYAINPGDVAAAGKVETGASIVVDKNDNIYIAGTFEGPDVDFDPGAGKALFTSRQNDIFFAKYDNRGNYVFTKTVSGNQQDYAHAIKLDKQNNIVICGEFLSYSIDFDPGAGTSVLASKGKSDIFFAKYDSLGNYLFAKSIGGIKFDDANAIAIGTDNSIIVTGTFENKNVDFDAGDGTYLLSASPYNDDNFITKYDGNGNFIFAFNIGGVNNAYGNDVGVDKNNNIFITGLFNGNAVDFDPGPDVFTIPGSKYMDMYIAKYTAGGKLLFANAIGNTDESENIYSYVSRLIVNKNGTISTSGYYTGTLDVDPGGDTVNISAPSATLFIVNYTNNGDYVSAVSADNYTNYYNAETVIAASTVDSAGNAYIAGYFNGRYDFDPGPGVYLLESLDDYRFSSYFAKYDKSGRLLFAKALIGGESLIYAMAVDGDENIYLTGQGGGLTDFDPSAAIKYLNNSDTALRLSGYFFAKYSKDGALIFANGEGTSFEQDARSIAIDEDKNIYIAGGFYDSLDFDPGPGVHKIKTLGDEDIFFAKYDASGNFVFAYNIGLNGYYNSASHIALNSKGDIIITGSLHGSLVDFDPGPRKFLLSAGPSGGAAFITAYHNSGAFINAFSIKGTKGYYNADITSAFLDAENNIYAAGSYNGDIDFNPGDKVDTLIPASGLFFVSYDPSGHFKFVKGISTYTPAASFLNALNSITVDKEKNIYVAGEFGSIDIDCDPGQDTALLVNKYYDATNNANLNLFIAKYDSAGNYRYSYEFTGDSAVGGNFSAAINIDRDGNIVYAAYGKTKIDFDPGAGSAFPFADARYNLFLTKYTQLPDCEVPDSLYTNSIRPTSAKLNWQYATNPQGFKIQYKPSQQVAWSTVSTGGAARAVVVSNLSPSIKYAWRVKASCMDRSSAYSDTVTFTTVANTTSLAAVEEMDKGVINSHFVIYPNPVATQFLLQLQNIQQAVGQATAVICDAHGVMITTTKLDIVNHAIRKTIQVPPALAKGSYFIKVAIAGVQYSAAFIKA